MGKTFATTSGKGGVGKSSVATGLGLSFASLGKSVLLVDMDEGLGSLDLLLGVDEEAVLNLSDALLAEDLTAVPYKCGKGDLYLIPATHTAGEIDPLKFEAFAKAVQELYDIVIFDFPAGLDFSLYSLLPDKTLFLTVATPDRVSVKGAAAVGEALYKQRLNSRLIINRFSLKKGDLGYLKGIDGIIDSASVRLLGIIPESKEIHGISASHKIKKSSKANKAFERIAKRLLDENIPLQKLKRI